MKKLTTHSNDFLQGMRYLLTGFSWLNRKGLKRHVIIPLFINIVFFVGLFWFAGYWFADLTQWVNHFLPSWLQWLDWLFWIIFAIASFIVLVFTFTIFANLFGAPFNGFLSEKTAEIYRGKRDDDNSSFKEILKEIPRALLRQGQYIWYYLPRALVFIVLFFVPLLQVIAGPLWFVFNSWMMSVQYVDYPMDNRRVEFRRMREIMGEKRMLNFGFGLAVLVATMIPLVNFFVMPAAVIGATLMYEDRLKDDKVI